MDYSESFNDCMNTDDLKETFKKLRSGVIAPDEVLKLETAFADRLKIIKRKEYDKERNKIRVQKNRMMREMNRAAMAQKVNTSAADVNGDGDI